MDLISQHTKVYAFLKAEIMSNTGEETGLQFHMMRVCVCVCVCVF